MAKLQREQERLEKKKERQEKQEERKENKEKTLKLECLISITDLIY